MNGAELKRKKFKPLDWAMKGPDGGVIPFGQLFLMGGTSGAARKSWLLDELALAGAEGGHWMGDLFEAPQPYPALLIANEDNYRRVEERLELLRAGRPALDPDPQKAAELQKAADHRLDVWAGDELANYDEGGLEDIRRWVEEVNQPCLVIIDILMNFRELSSTYRQDRRMIRELGKFAHSTGCALGFSLHLRKGRIREGTSWTDNLHCSSGVPASTENKIGIDAILGANEGRLLYFGKDVENHAYRLERTDYGSWRAMVPEDIPTVSDEDKLSEQRRLLLRVVTQHPGLGPGMIHEIQPKGPDGQDWESNAVKQTLYQMWKKGQLVNEGGCYYTPAQIRDRDQAQAEMWTPVVLQGERLANR